MFFAIITSKHPPSTYSLETKMTNLLDSPVILATRRNHGLEHATIHILSGQFPGKALAGHSNPRGFFILGDVPTTSVREAATEALARMRNGESNLAVHPGCGTNYVVAGALAGTLAWLGMSGAKTGRQRRERLPLVILLSTLGFMASQPLGPVIQQRITTSGDPGDLVIVDVYCVRKGVHRIVTQG
jgi:hypothetical protein